MAIPYGALSRPFTWHGETIVERILPGAVTVDMKVVADRGHRPYTEFASTDTGRLRLIDDEEALRFEMFPADATHGRAAVNDVRRGLTKGASIQFTEATYTWGRSGEHRRRDVSALRLIRVSLAAYPIYTDTTVELAEPALTH